MNTESVSEPPSSTVSFSSYADSYSSPHLLPYIPAIHLWTSPSFVPTAPLGDQETQSGTHLCLLPTGHRTLSTPRCSRLKSPQWISSTVRCFRKRRAIYSPLTCILRRCCLWRTRTSISSKTNGTRTILRVIQLASPVQMPPSALRFNSAHRCP
jgi:hypothetical protein